MGRSDQNKTHRDNFILSPWLLNCLDPFITARAFSLILQQKHFLCHWRGRKLICIITCINSSRDLVKTTSLSKYRKRRAEVGERCSLRDKVATFNWISEKCPGKFAPNHFSAKPHKAPRTCWSRSVKGRCTSTFSNLGEGGFHDISSRVVQTLFSRKKPFTFSTEAQECTRKTVAGGADPIHSNGRQLSRWFFIVLCDTRGRWERSW